MSLSTGQGVSGLPSARPILQPALEGQRASGSLSRPIGTGEKGQRSCAACPATGWWRQGHVGAKTTSSQLLSNTHS